jgi:hypothetical protein
MAFTPPALNVSVIGTGPIATTFVSVLRSANQAAGERAVRFELNPVSDVHSFYPRERSHDHEYEHYVPTGVLKAGWTHKHSEVFPALIIMVVAVDEPRPVDWGRVEAAVLPDLRELRDNVKDRQIEVHVVLIQDVNMPLISESMDYREHLSERLAA